MKRIQKVKKDGKCLAYWPAKTKFPDETTANKVVTRIWSHDPTVKLGDLHSYKCEVCNSWHVGHKKYYDAYLQRQGATA